MFIYLFLSLDNVNMINSLAVLESSSKLQSNDVFFTILEIYIYIYYLRYFSSFDIILMEHLFS